MSVTSESQSGFLPNCKGDQIVSTALKGQTLSQYLEQERKTGEKHEYYRGELFAMVRGTPQHALIATNFLREASQALSIKMFL